MNNVLKDCGEIWNRLFDHRPFLSGEILYFQEEFEVKRGDREVTKLFEVLESVTDIRDSQIDKLRTLSESQLPGLQAKLSAALSNCNAILDSEGQFDIDLNLSEKRKFRECERERFQDEMKAKYLNVDKQLDEKEREIIAFYSDLETKLHIKDPQEIIRD